MAKKSGPSRYAIYSRCSSDDQAHKDFSTIDVQDGLNRQYVGSQGGTVAIAYKDEGISGTTLKRKGWLLLLADAKAGRFDKVVVTYMSRLGRGDMFTVAEYLLKEVGVTIEMVKEQFSDDMSGHVNKKMTQFVDGMYVEQVRGWTRTKMEAMVAAGFFPGGYPPFGLMKVIAIDAAHFHKPDKEPPKRLVPDAETASIVRQAFALFLDTGQQAKVREYLNAVTTRSWTTTGVKNLLTNPVYKGDIVFGQWSNEGAYEAVVDPETWQAVQAAIAARHYRPAREKADEFIYYLHGRVQCPHCGCPYTQTSAWGRSSRVHYYICQTANRTASRGRVGPDRRICPVGRVNADRVHATVLGYMDHAATHRTFMHKLIAQSGGWGSADEAQKALRGQLGKQKQAVEMRIANYIKAIGDGRDSPALMSALDKAEAERETVIRQMEEADQQIAAATIQRPTAGQVQEAWSSLGRVWEVLNEEERTDLLSSVVQSVEVTEKESVTLELLPWSHSLMSSAQNHSERFGLCTPNGSGGRT
jgi:site-specific DNA recombinase